MSSQKHKQVVASDYAVKQLSLKYQNAGLQQKTGQNRMTAHRTLRWRECRGQDLARVGQVCSRSRTRKVLSGLCLWSTGPFFRGYCGISGMHLQQLFPEFFSTLFDITVISSPFPCAVSYSLTSPVCSNLLLIFNMHFPFPFKCCSPECGEIVADEKRDLVGLILVSF